MIRSISARLLSVGAAVIVGAALSVVSPATPANAAAICNKHCDGRDPALSPGDRQPVSTTMYGRRFVIHVDDADAMIWASVENGRRGDQVWLDRSFDGGRTWDESHLGQTSIPAGRTGWRTGMFNVDDWARRGVGVLRACGKAGDRREIACTPWARSTWNAGDRRTAAATALMMRFDPDTGVFDGNSWWTGANALTALIDTVKRTGLHSYDYVIATTYDRNVRKRGGEFRNEYLDDTGWWGLAWVAAYDVTRDTRYLKTARADADYMHSYWDKKCGGGVYWKTDKAGKNAIENSLYIQLNAALAQRVPGDTVYRGRARAAWKWFQSTGMLNGSNLVHDAIDMKTCRSDGDTTWTYNQGVLINALVQLHKVTGDARTLATAREIGDALTTSGELSPNGILREPIEPDGCASDGASFKGAAIRGLGVLNAATGGAYNTYLRRNADMAYAKARDSIDAYGSHWSGPFRGSNHSCQHSALDLLNAAP